MAKRTDASITNRKSQMARWSDASTENGGSQNRHPKIVNRQSSIGNVDWRITGKGAAASGNHFSGGNPGKVNFGRREEDYEQSTF
jgi:hypothetical protein